MKKKLLIGIALIFCQSTFSQQDPILTQFWNSSTLFNPANSGLFYRHQGSFNYRNQWVGFSGAPSSIIATYNTKIKKIKSGLGFNYLNEGIGNSQIQRADLNYSYHLELENKNTLSFGLSLGLNSEKFNSAWIAPTTSNDPLLPKSLNTQILVPNFGMVYKAEKFDVGLSSTNIVGVELNNGSYNVARHYYLSGSYNFNLNSNILLKPQILIRTDVIYLIADYNVMASYKNKYYLGFTFRSIKTFCFIAGVDFKEKFKLAYSYDYGNSNSFAKFRTHELTLGFLLK